MISQKEIDKIKAYSEGILTEEESASVYTLFSENEDNPGFENHFRTEFYEYLKNSPEVDHNLSHLLGNIHHAINLNKVKAEKSFTRRIYRWYSAAAVFLLPVLFAGAIWLYIQKPRENTISENPVTASLYAPMGSRINFSLPDGTKGWLNSGSSLDYQLPFNQNRKVSLKGEVWLDVTHDENHPFEVSAGKTNIKVLGTEFNINAFPEEKYVEVVLNNGKVEFTAPGIASAIEMKPNERLVYTADSVKIGLTEAFKYSSWKEGKLVFRGDPMAEVARRIERWYNVEVQLADEELTKYVIRGTFEDDSLEDVFRYLAMTSPIRYRIIDRKVETDSTFTKTKVVVYKKSI